MYIPWLYRAYFPALMLGDRRAVFSDRRWFLCRFAVYMFVVKLALFFWFGGCFGVIRRHAHDLCGAGFHR